jgi:hypothetical protein
MTVGHLLFAAVTTPERLGRLEVDHQLEFDRMLDAYLARLRDSVAERLDLATSPPPPNRRRRSPRAMRTGRRRQGIARKVQNVARLK